MKISSRDAAPQIPTVEGTLPSQISPVVTVIPDLSIVYTPQLLYKIPLVICLWNANTRQRDLFRNSVKTGLARQLCCGDGQAACCTLLDQSWRHE